MLSFTCEVRHVAAGCWKPTGGHLCQVRTRILGWSAARYHPAWCCSAPFHPIRKIIRGGAGIQRWGQGHGAAAFGSARI